MSRGWPDLLCYKQYSYFDKNENKSIITSSGLFIECKNDREQLSGDQQKLHNRLKRLGIPVFTIRPGTIESADLGNKIFIFNSDTFSIEEKIKKLKKEIRRLNLEMEEIKKEYDNTAILLGPTNRKGGVSIEP